MQFWDNRDKYTMPKDTQSINQSLFELLDSKGYEPTMLDTSGKEIAVPEEADVFQFNFTKDGENYGPVTITIDGLHRLIIYYGKKVAESPKEASGDPNWYSLLRHLKRWAKDNQLSFELNFDKPSRLKYDMAKRDHTKRKDAVNEGYHPMGRKASYNDAIPEVKMIIQHTRQIEEGEQRYRNIAKIFVENQLGERFAIPTNKPGLARVYARHIAEGGTPYDDRGRHITSLLEEYNKMAGFVRATRTGQFTESAQELVSKGINHYQSIRETLHKMTGKKGYNNYFESWTPPLMEDDAEDTNLNELFVQETLDPRIENVMPILSKLHKTVAEMKEVTDLAEWADTIIENELHMDAPLEEGAMSEIDTVVSDMMDPYIDRLLQGLLDPDHFTSLISKAAKVLANEYGIAEQDAVTLISGHVEDRLQDETEE